jgi:hypothetical protein
MAYLAIDRNEFDDVFWNETREFSRFEAWLYLQQKVSYQDRNEGFINGTHVSWGRGQYPLSISYLAKSWNWSDQKVRTYLDYLKRTGRITRETTGNVTILTVCNYGKCMDKQQAEQQGNDQAEKQEERQGDNQTNNKGKTGNINIKPSNHLKRTKKSINTLMSELASSDERYVQIAYSFWSLFKSNTERLKIKSADLEKARYSGWVEPVRLMVERDKRTDSELEEVFVFLKDEIPGRTGFAWAKVIRSTASLRKQFEKILIEVRSHDLVVNSKVVNAVTIENNLLRKIEETSTL